MAAAEVLQTVGDLVSPLSLQFGLRLLLNSPGLDDLRDENVALYDQVKLLVDECQAFDVATGKSNAPNSGASPGTTMKGFERAEKKMFTQFHATAAIVEDSSLDDEQLQASLAALEDSLRQYRSQKRQSLLQTQLVNAIVSRNVEQLSSAIESAGPKQRWAIAGRVVLQNLLGDGPSSLKRSEAGNYSKIKDSLIKAESKLAAAAKRVEMLERENGSTHERLLQVKRDLREAKARNEVLEKTTHDTMLDMSPRLRQVGSAKLAMEAAERNANMLQQENQTLENALGEAKREIRDLQSNVAKGEEKLDAQQNLHTQTAIRRIQRDFEEEKRKRERAERQLSHALKEAQMHGKNSEGALQMQQQSSYATAQAKAAVETAKRMKQEAKVATAKASSQLGEQAMQVQQLEYELETKSEQIEELKGLLAEKEAEVRAEGSREMLKQQAEVERLKTMMEWKAKIVEDDVKFRTESGWRERTKMLVQEIEHLRQVMEATMMEKRAAETALRDLGVKLSQKDQALSMSQQHINHLNSQLQTTHHLRDTVLRLQRATEDQWKQVANRDESTLRHLESELLYFQQQTSEYNDPAEGKAGAGRGGARRGGHGGGGVQKSSSMPTLGGGEGGGGGGGGRNGYMNQYRSKRR